VPGPIHLPLLSFDDVPTFPRAHWEVDVGWRDLPHFLDRHVNDPTTPLDLDPDFQRGHVWTLEQKTAYIEYVLQAGEQGKVLVSNCPGWDSVPKGPHQLVDGKQRLEAALGFLRDEVPAFGRLRSQYTGAMRYYIGFKWRILALNTRAEVLRFYLAFNAGGTPHAASEIERVRGLLREEEAR